MYYIKSMKKEVASFRVERIAWLRLGRKLKKFKMSRGEFLRKCVDLALVDDEFISVVTGR